MATAPVPAPGPLAGIRIADCSTVLAGPYCTMLLADLGAEVVKVEPPEGDATRGWGPPWVGSAADGTRTAAYFLAVNRNKRSIRLDLKRAGGREVLSRLLAASDVLVENFRVGGLARLGFDDAALEAINPALVHLAISGFGPDGPDARKPGYDFVVQAAGGLMSITGAPDADSGRPTKVGVAISDVVTGLFGAVSVLAGLIGRDRAGAAGAASGAGDKPPGAADPASGAADRAGAATPASRGGRAGGQRIDVSLLESTLAILVNQAQNAFVSGVAPGRLGNAHPNLVPYETFATDDGELAVAVGSERQWPRLCDALGIPDLAQDARFTSNGGRVENRAILRPLLAARFATRPTAAWLEALDAAGIPCGPINDVAAAFASPQARARGMAVEVDHPVLGAIRQAGLPFTLSATPASIRTAPPLLGEHTAEVLAALGYDEPAIRALVEAAVV